MGEKVIGFSTEQKAEDYISEMSEPNIQDMGHGFVITKGIVKANNGTFHPVLLSISVRDYGELFGAYFFVEGFKETLPQENAISYIEGGEEALYPYQYKTLTRIREDFHQGNWPDFS